MCKKVVVILVILIVTLFCLGVQVKSQEKFCAPRPITYKITLEIGSKQISINNAGYMMDFPPYIKNGRTMIFIGFIDGIFGYTIEKNEEEIIIKDGGIQITMKLDSEFAFLSYDSRRTYKFALDAPLEIKEGIIFVPIRFISEQTGLHVSWDEKEKKVIIDNQEEIQKTMPLLTLSLAGLLILCIK